MRKETDVLSFELLSLRFPSGSDVNHDTHCLGRDSNPVSRNTRLQLCQVDSEGFSRWCIKQNYYIFRLRPSSGILKKLQSTRFRKLYLFPSSGEGETPALLGPSERANLIHTTASDRHVVVWKKCMLNMTYVENHKKSREILVFSIGTGIFA
jgi:hypothetical protein